jgi:hypothetical protein
MFEEVTGPFIIQLHIMIFWQTYKMDGQIRQKEGKKEAWKEMEFNLRECLVQ